MLDVLPLQFFIQLGAEITDFISLIFLLFKFLLDFPQFLRKTLYALFEFLNLTPSSEQVAVVPERTSCHGTARAQELALEGYHAERLTVFPLNHNGMVDRVDHQRSSKQLCHKALIHRVVRNKCICHTKHTGFSCRILIHLRFFPAHTGERKERRTAEMAPFQVFNQVFRRRLIVGDNILNAAAKCGLDRRLVLFLRLQKIRHNAVDAGIPVLLLHDLPNTVSIAVVPLGDVL